MVDTTQYVETHVSIYFPGDTVRCALCPLLQTYSRNQCNRTGEYIADTRARGIWCPLEIEEREDGGNNG